VPDDPFKHVVLLMLENHSFDQMLGCMTGVHPDIDGIRPGVTHVNRDAHGREYAQEPRDALQVKPDPKHDTANVLAQLADHNGGFIRDYLGAHGEDARANCPDIMGYFPRGSLPALHTLAEQFVVCDRWFASLPGPTWPNRFFALTGTSNGRVLMPEGLSHLGMLTTQTQDTIFDRLNAKGVTWNVYFYDFPASLLLRHQRRPVNLRNYLHIDEFFAQASRDEDSLASFVFVEPKYMGLDQNDDHPPHNVMKAQKLVADVYNAIRSNPALWATTLLVVLYDEHGGFYDHVEPPAAAPPDDNREEFAFDRLGVRVPAVLVSPHLRPGVIHAELQHTSLLRYLMGKWGLDALGARTTGPDALGDSLPWAPAMRTKGMASFIRVPYGKLVPPEPEWERQDWSTHHEGLHLVADVLEASDEALGAAVADAAKAAAAYEGSLARVRASIGDRLIAIGRALRKPLETAQAERLARTSRAVRQALGHNVRT
jgi:phospholipase C